MAKDIFIFKRIEKKYFLSEGQKSALLSEISSLLVPDEHGKSTVCNLYLDTPSFLLIRNSIDAVSYKEKLRVRCYNGATEESKAFLEIKKKLKGVVYKRRVALPYSKIIDYIASSYTPPDSQIMREIDYAMKFYGNPQPAVALYYDREAYYIKDDPAVRLTFDSNIRYRDYDLSLTLGSYGKEITPPTDDRHIVLEIKTDGAMPLEIAHALDKFNITPHSFSKYATAYCDILSSRPKEIKKIHNKEFTHG